MGIGVVRMEQELLTLIARVQAYHAAHNVPVVAHVVGEVQVPANLR